MCTENSEEKRVCPACDESLKKRHVVIIDDRITARNMLVGLVGTLKSGVLVESYSDPLEAVEALNECPPDLVITDYHMPGMNGIELVQHMRADPKLASVPVIMVTLSEDSKIRSEAIKAGVNDFLSRPIDPQECRARCLSLLNLCEPCNHH